MIPFAAPAAQVKVDPSKAKRPIGDCLRLSAVMAGQPGPAFGRPGHDAKRAAQLA
jgi:hypothetical protein